VLEKKKKEPEFSFSAPPKDYVFLSNVKVEQPEWMGTIGIEGFVNCCGAGILWGFGGLRTIDDAVCFVREGTRRIAAQQKGMALAIINYSQLNVCQPALEANGYRCVSAATNPVHGDMSYIFS
jgi:hypothetical protein